MTGGDVFPIGVELVVKRFHLLPGDNSTWVLRHSDARADLDELAPVDCGVVRRDSPDKTPIAVTVDGVGELRFVAQRGLR